HQHDERQGAPHVDHRAEQGPHRRGRGEAALVRGDQQHPERQSEQCGEERGPPHHVEGVQGAPPQVRPHLRPALHQPVQPSGHGTSSTSTLRSVRYVSASALRSPVIRTVSRPTACPATSSNAPPRMLTSTSKSRVSWEMSGSSAWSTQVSVTTPSPETGGGANSDRANSDLGVRSRSTVRPVSTTEPRSMIATASQIRLTTSISWV